MAGFTAEQVERLRAIVSGRNLLGHTPTPVEQTLAAALLRLMEQQGKCD